MFQVYSVRGGYGAQRGAFDTLADAAQHARAIAEIETARADVRDASDALVWQSIPFAIVQADKARAARIAAIRKAELAAYRNGK
jgi:hypothetical protein